MNMDKIRSAAKRARYTINPSIEELLELEPRSALSANIRKSPRLVLKKPSESPELVAILLEPDLSKAAGHKYLARYPTGKERPRYRYVYKYPSRKKLTTEEHLHEGTKVKVEHAGKEGHFEVLGHDKERGLVHLRHDESGRTAHVKLEDLHRMVQAYHTKRGTAAVKEAKKAAPKKKPEPEAPPLKLRLPETQTRLKPVVKPAPPAKSGPAPELPVVTLSDLGNYEGIQGVYDTKSQAEQVAHYIGSDDQEYAVVQQPGGYVLTHRKRVARAGSEYEAPGSATDVFIRDSSGKGITALAGQYALVEADKLIPSHTLGGQAPREDYPEGVQERRYHELPGEQMKIDRIARHLTPAIVANSNPDGVNGTPVVTETGVVLGGNGRTMGMQLAYARYPESADKLKRYLEANAHAFGLSSAEVRGMRAPILVRKISAGTDPAHLRMIGRRLNQALTQGLDPRTAEVATARNFVNEHLTDVLVDTMQSDETLAQFLHSGRSQAFIAGLERAGIIDNLNRDEYVVPYDPNRPDPQAGLLNEDGRTMVERVLAAKFIPDAALLSKMRQESRQAIASSVPYLLRAQHAGWDLSESLTTAVRADLSFRRQREKSKLSVKDFLGQQSLFEAGKAGDDAQARVQGDPVARALFMVMQDIGPKKTPAGFREFARRAEAAERERGEGQANLFGGGEPPETPDVALDNAFGITPEGRAAVAQREKEAESQLAEYAQSMGITTAEAKKLAAKQKAEKQKAEKLAQRRAPAEGGEQAPMFAASMGAGDLVKGRRGTPAYLMDAVIREMGYIVRAKANTAALTGQPFKPDREAIKREVNRWLLYALTHDDRMAQALAKQPLDQGALDGIIDAVVRQSGGELRKAQVYWWGPWPAAGTLRKAEVRPPGAGWVPIPGGTRGGYRKRGLDHWLYWYPEQGVHRVWQGKPTAPGPVSKYQAELEAKAVDHMDDVHRALVVAERVHRTNAGAAQHPRYGAMLREFPAQIERIKGQISRSKRIEEVHRLQEKARAVAKQVFEVARDYETRQTGLFGENDTSLPESRELSAADMEHHARELTRLEAQSEGKSGKTPWHYYMDALTNRYGKLGANAVYERSQEMGGKRKAPRLTVEQAAAHEPEPKKPTRPEHGGQMELFGGNQLSLF